VRLAQRQLEGAHGRRGRLRRGKGEFRQNCPSPSYFTPFFSKVRYIENLSPLCQWRESWLGVSRPISSWPTKDAARLRLGRERIRRLFAAMMDGPAGFYLPRHSRWARSSSARKFRVDDAEIFFPFSRDELHFRRLAGSREDE